MAFLSNRRAENKCKEKKKRPKRKKRRSWAGRQVLAEFTVYKPRYKHHWWITYQVPVQALVIATILCHKGQKMQALHWQGNKCQYGDGESLQRVLEQQSGGNLYQLSYEAFPEAGQIRVQFIPIVWREWREVYTIKMIRVTFSPLSVKPFTIPNLDCICCQTMSKIHQDFLSHKVWYMVSSFGVNEASLFRPWDVESHWRDPKSIQDTCQTEFQI